MLRKFSVLAIGVALFSVTQAQDTEPPKPTISGSADVYYRYNFANPETDENNYNNFTSFTNSHNSFELGMLSLKAEHTMGKVGMVADLGFGRRAEEFSYNDVNTMLAIKQLYVTYAPSDKVTFTFGSFGTHVGYELLDAYLNRNYSMSYMFSYGPFFHTGLKADFSLSDRVGLMVGVTNPTDLKTASAAPKMIIGQLSLSSKDEKLSLYLNYQGGKTDDDNRLFQGDITGTYAVSDKFGLGLNTTLQSRSMKDVNGDWMDGNAWYGAALYLNVDPTSWFGFTLRTEYFNDDKDVLGFNTTLLVPTISANFKADNLTIIPEFRFDTAKDEIFAKNPGDFTKSTGSFILAATYHF